MAVVILADAPELLALAALASVPASKMADAFNDAEHFFDHLTLDELKRLSGAVERLSALSKLLAESAAVYAREAQRIIAEAQEAEDDAD